MTGGDGERHEGKWRITVVDPPAALQFEDISAHVDGLTTTELPATRVGIRLTPRESGTRMTMTSQFASREDLERWLSAGVREGLEQASAQMDELLRR